MQNNFNPQYNEDVDKLKDTYLNWTKIQLNSLYDLLQSLEKSHIHSPSSLIAKIFDLSHNIKGLGGSFGYYLITDIAASLCEYVRHKETLFNPQPYIISAHIRAMKVVLSEQIEGSGGEEGNNIIIRLHKMIEEENNNKMT